MVLEIMISMPLIIGDCMNTICMQKTPKELQVIPSIL